VKAFFGFAPTAACPSLSLTWFSYQYFDKSLVQPKPKDGLIKTPGSAPFSVLLSNPRVTDSLICCVFQLTKVGDVFSHKAGQF